MPATGCAPGAPPGPVTADALHRAEAAYRKAAATAEDRRADRNRVVLRALEQGWSQRQIAAATGLSNGRVGQIASAAQEQDR